MIGPGVAKAKEELTRVRPYLFIICLASMTRGCFRAGSAAPVPKAIQKISSRSPARMCSTS